MTDTAEETGLEVALVSLSHHVLHLFSEVGRSHGLTQQQVELICAVIVRGRVGMSELGRQLHLEKTNLSNLLDRAEQRGLAVRLRDAGDRRVTWVELTDEGTRLAMQTHAEVTARLGHLTSELPASDKRHLAAVIERILATASSPG